MGVVAALAATLSGVAGGRVGAPAIVDRTFSCEAGFVGGLHQVNLSVVFSTQPGSRIQPSAEVTRNLFEAALGRLAPEGVSVHRQRCLPTRAKLRLTTKEMRGGAVSQLGAEVTCETPRRLFLRVRAVFTGRATVETRRDFGFPQLVARGDVVNAAIAVGAPKGKPLAYLALTKAGKARLFTGRTCKED